ncbi:MAG: hypothetical protein CM1200mP41_02550 [Gammaproteobacteria bacterium]|nr:MAG: hypothetical protein CM1200mP41_02550 [Gammaproteobacteria bacterium]
MSAPGYSRILTSPRQPSSRLFGLIPIHSMPLDMIDSFDVCIIGAGNAALCAAISAAENNARTLVLERAPQEESGGNSDFPLVLFASLTTADDLREICDLSDEEIRTTEFGFTQKINSSTTCFA